MVCCFFSSLTNCNGKLWGSWLLCELLKEGGKGANWFYFYLEIAFSTVRLSQEIVCEQVLQWGDLMNTVGCEAQAFPSLLEKEVSLAFTGTYSQVKVLQVEAAMGKASWRHQRFQEGWKGNSGGGHSIKVQRQVYWIARDREVFFNEYFVCIYFYTLY